MEEQLDEDECQGYYWEESTYITSDDSDDEFTKVTNNDRLTETGGPGEGGRGNTTPASPQILDSLPLFNSSLLPLLLGQSISENRFSRSFKQYDNETFGWKDYVSQGQSDHQTLEECRHFSVYQLWDALALFSDNIKIKYCEIFFIKLYFSLSGSQGNLCYQRCHYPATEWDW